MKHSTKCHAFGFFSIIFLYFFVSSFEKVRMFVGNRCFRFTRIEFGYLGNFLKFGPSRKPRLISISPFRDSFLFSISLVSICMGMTGPKSQSKHQLSEWAEWMEHPQYGYFWSTYTNAHKWMSNHFKNQNVVQQVKQILFLKVLIQQFNSIFICTCYRTWEKNWVRIVELSNVNFLIIFKKRPF